MNIFSQAAQGLNLSPSQRAFLKLFKGWAYTALGSGLIVGSEYLTNNGQIDWHRLVYISGGAVLLSILNALDKFWSSQGDAPLALATEAVEQRVQQAAPQAARPSSVPQFKAPLFNPAISQDSTPLAAVQSPSLPPKQ